MSAFVEPPNGGWSRHPIGLKPSAT